MDFQQSLSVSLNCRSVQWWPKVGRVNLFPPPSLVRTHSNMTAFSPVGDIQKKTIRLTGKGNIFTYGIFLFFFFFLWIFRTNQKWSLSKAQYIFLYSKTHRRIYNNKKIKIKLVHKKVLLTLFSSFSFCKKINKKFLPLWWRLRQSYYPHWLTDSLSPVFRLFSLKGQKSLGPRPKPSAGARRKPA